MARRREEDNPFAGLDDSSLRPRPASDQEAELEDDGTVDFPEPTPSRANALQMLALADDETDVVIAGYYVQRAIAESLMLIVQRLDVDR